MRLQIDTSSKTVNNAAQVTEGNNVQEQLKVGDAGVEVPLKCCYPDCIFVNMPTSPPLDVCQGMCSKKGRFHHACNVSWLESKGIDAELREISYACECAQYSDV